jgi:hypothetical protein
MLLYFNKIDNLIVALPHIASLFKVKFKLLNGLGIQGFRDVIHLSSSIRNLVLLLFFILSSYAIEAQIQSAGPGNWNLPATWVGGVPPGAGDNVIIRNGHTVTLSDVRACNNLTINQGGTLQIGGANFSVNGTTNISGTLSDNTNTGTDNFIGQVTISATGVWNTTTVTTNNLLRFSNGIQNNNTAANSFQTGFAGFVTNNQTISGTGAILFNGNVRIETTVVVTNINSSTVTIIGTIDRLFAGDTPTWINGNGSTLVYNNSGVPFASSGTLNASTASNTVIYGRGGNQLIYAKAGSNTYYHLITSNSGIKTLQGNISVNGDLTIGSGTTLDVSVSNFSIDLKGNWTNSNTGTFTFRTGTVTFSGTSGQSISRSNGETFYNLTLSNSAGLTLSNGNVTVNNILNMMSGNINTGAYRLTLGTSTANNGSLTHTSGTIIGEFQRWLSNTGTSYLFPIGTAANYRPALITFTNLTAGSLIGRFISGDPGDNGLAVMDGTFCVDEQFTEGYWSFNTANLASNNYNLELTANVFTSYTIDSETRLITRANSSSGWTVNGTHVAATGSTVKRSNLSIISAEYGLGDGDPTTVTATISPDPASVCAATDLNITGNPSGGSEVYVSHQWTGSGSGYLSATNIQSPDFNSSNFGSFDLTYIVTDNIGCSGSANITITANPTPAITIGYSYSKILSVDPNQVPGTSDLKNFPVLIRITDTDLSDHVENANGYDIIFSDINYNKLSHELESYNPAGQLTAWVLVPVLDCNDSTKIRMFYGNSQVTSDLSSQDVWADYLGVWHLLDYSDAAGNSVNGTNFGAVTTAGIISSGQQFDGGDRITVPQNTILEPTDSITVSLWVRRNGTQSPFAKPVWYGRNTPSPYGPYGFEFANDTDYVMQFHIASQSAYISSRSGTIIINDGTWYYLTGVYNGSVALNYVNNNLTDSKPIPGPIGHYNTMGLAIGDKWETGQGFTGIVDELRISRFLRTPEWIDTEYNNQRENSTFIKRGSEITNSISHDTICPNSVNINYSVPATGNTYNWEVNGGNISSGAGTNSILVDFFGGPTGNIILSETNTYCSAADTFDILIDDFRDPVALCKDTVVYLDATGNVTIDSSYINNSSSDNCGIWTITLDKTDFDCGDIGDNTVIMTVTDRKGNTDQCNAKVIVVDNLNPALTCVANQTRNTDPSECNRTAVGGEFDITGASDNCVVKDTTYQLAVATILGETS